MRSEAARTAEATGGDDEENLYRFLERSSRTHPIRVISLCQPEWKPGENDDSGLRWPLVPAARGWDGRREGGELSLIHI